jgi:GNAT superfamily N-acetyltransferase
MPTGAASLVAEAIDGLLGTLPGVSGEQEALREAVTRWQQLRPSARVTGSRGMRLFRLDELAVPDVPGFARRATKADLDLLRAWYVAFSADADADHSRRRAEHAVPSARPGRLRAVGGRRTAPVVGRLHPVVAGVARIGPVYTPDEHRRHGCGAAVTATASQAARHGTACEVVLFTDLGNPTSNKIYTQIGFRPLGDYLEVSTTG